MKTYLYRLRFHGPVHFGTTSTDLENTRNCVSSDSLFSALINSFSVSGQADEAVSALMQENPAFVLSSLFPFGPSEDNTGTVYALPCPLNTPPVRDEKILTDHGKYLRQIKYLTPPDFFSWIGDTPLDSEAAQAIIERSKKLARPWDREKGKGWWSEELRPRGATGRTDWNSSAWRCLAVHFHKDAGLYGLVRINDEKWEEKLSGAFSLLGDMGLGGERTYGMSFFDFSGFESLAEMGPGMAKTECLRFVLLSNYFPADNERPDLSEVFEAWDFTESRGYVVSGRMATNFKRKRIKMVVEGSVVKEPVMGKIADVTPDNPGELGLPHRVCRSGLAFLMPLDSALCSSEDQGGAK